MTCMIHALVESIGLAGWDTDKCIWYIKKKWYFQIKIAYGTMTENYIFEFDPSSLLEAWSTKVKPHEEEHARSGEGEA